MKTKSAVSSERARADKNEICAEHARDRAARANHRTLDSGAIHTVASEAAIPAAK